MLKIYGWSVCPHCRKTVDYLQQHNIPFQYLEIEEQDPSVIAKVVEVNGGEDWVVPTLEFEGKWRPGKIFDAAGLEKDLHDLGVLE